MANEIITNFVYLSEHITNLESILNHLLQDGVISIHEKEEISQNTSLKSSSKLLALVLKKDWNLLGNVFVEILKQTNNAHCAHQIEKSKDSKATGKNRKNERDDSTSQRFEKSGNRKCENIGKWWPDKKILIKSLHKRKFGTRLLVEEIHERVLNDDNRMVVICESSDAAKYSGMGGIGKTLTAKWYAHHYEDYYDHILWIDCGEGSLSTSFENLAMELEIKNWDKYNEVKNVARKCFENLNEFKCLWIYDNAESYQETEGIKHVLPRYQQKFVCLITSRSRDWGVENGYGKISDLQLEIFSQTESLEFLQTNLEKETKYTEDELNQLCRLLGNLPLALQLAVAALNSSQMDVKTYIEKSKFVKVLDAKFDDYEKTINGNVKVSLDLIGKEDGGTTAKEILLVFGYILPDDIKLDFFKSVLQIQDDTKIKQSLKLLKKYSLVAKTRRNKVYYDDIVGKIMNTWGKENDKEIVLSIHRLLQQVIRHNGKGSEKETLRKILSCDGFIDYKLLPFTKYADEELRKEFPKVKAELLDQKQLENLMEHKRFEECVELAKFVDEELKRNTTRFNYAICLHENGQVEESVKTANELLDMIQLTKRYINFGGRMVTILRYLKAIKLPVNVKRHCNLMSLTLFGVDVGDGVGVDDIGKLRKEIGDLLLFTHLRLGKFDDAIIAIGKQEANHEQSFSILIQVMSENKFEECVQLAQIIDQELKINTTKFNYAICLKNNGHVEECVETLEKLYELEMEEEIKYSYSDVEIGLLKLDIEVSKELVGCHLLITYSTMNSKIKNILDMRRQFTAIYSQENLGVLIRLVHSNLITCKYSLTTDGSFINLKLDVGTTEIELSSCSLSLCSFNRLSAEKLTLKYVSFFRDGEKLEEVEANDFLDLAKINSLTLECHKNVSIDLSGEFSLEFLQLGSVQVLAWNNSNWNVRELHLRNHISAFQDKTKIKVQEMKIDGYALNVSSLPQTLEKITLDTVKFVLMLEGVELPNLKNLTLRGVDDVDCLTPFRSVPVTHIYLDRIKEVDVDILPQTLTHLQITNYTNYSIYNGDSEDYNEDFDNKTRIVGGVRKVDTLMLQDFFFKEVEECLSHVQTDNLIIIHGIYSEDLIELMNKQIKTIVIGGMSWHDEADFKTYSTCLDRQADFYFVEGGRGMAMEEEQFKEFVELNCFDIKYLYMSMTYG